MKAIAYFENLPADHPEALRDITLPEPVPGERDLLVEVRAISVNPVDVKIRANRKPGTASPRSSAGTRAGVRAPDHRASACLGPATSGTPARWTAPAPTASCTRSMSASSAACRTAWTMPRPPRCR